MIVRFPLELLLAFTVILVGRLAWYLYRQVHCPAERPLKEVIPFLRPVDRDEVEELADPVRERMLRLNLGERQFQREQRKRMERLLEQGERMFHNAGFLLEGARRGRRTALTLGDSVKKAASERLSSACIEVRGGVRAIQAALFFWRIKAAVYPPARNLPNAKIQAVMGVEEEAGADALHGDQAEAPAVPAAENAIVLFSP